MYSLGAGCIFKYFQVFVKYFQVFGLPLKPRALRSWSPEPKDRAQSTEPKAQGLIHCISSFFSERYGQRLKHKVLGMIYHPGLCCEQIGTHCGSLLTAFSAASLAFCAALRAAFSISSSKKLLCWTNTCSINVLFTTKLRFHEQFIVGPHMLRCPENLFLETQQEIYVS